MRFFLKEQVLQEVGKATKSGDLVSEGSWAGQEKSTSTGQLATCAERKNRGGC